MIKKCKDFTFLILCSLQGVVVVGVMIVGEVVAGAVVAVEVVVGGGSRGWYQD